MDDVELRDLVKESGERTEHAITSLASEIRTMASAITKGFASVQGRSHSEEGGSRNQLFGFSGIMFGLLMPVYVVLGMMVTHMGSDAHPRAEERLSALERQTISAFEHTNTENKKLDTKIQQEVRLGEQRLQNEMVLRDTIVKLGGTPPPPFPILPPSAVPR